jgi:galactokinase
MLVDYADNHQATLGARMMGGGFGGCTVNLVLRSGLPDFFQAVGHKYEAATGLIPEFHVIEADSGVREHSAMLDC